MSSTSDNAGNGFTGKRKAEALGEGEALRRARQSSISSDAGAGVKRNDLEIPGTQVEMDPRLPAILATIELQAAIRRPTNTQLTSQIKIEAVEKSRLEEDPWARAILVTTITGMTTTKRIDAWKRATMARHLPHIHPGVRDLGCDLNIAPEEAIQNPQLLVRVPNKLKVMRAQLQKNAIERKRLEGVISTFGIDRDREVDALDWSNLKNPISVSSVKLHEACMELEQRSDAILELCRGRIELYGDRKRVDVVNLCAKSDMMFLTEDGYVIIKQILAWPKENQQYYDLCKTGTATERAMWMAAKFLEYSRLELRRLFKNDKFLVSPFDKIFNESRPVELFRNSALGESPFP